MKIQVSEIPFSHSADRYYKEKPYHIALAYNPSHLEAINPVVSGNVRARMDRNETKPFAILMHGDASIAGQGVVMETLSMSQVNAYHIGGTVHIVVNNQIGFTTEPKDGRSSVYCTDIAKMIQSPVMHVQADNVEAVIKTAIIAAMYRDKFKKDVFIDLVGYRKYGHNEADEPRATQPLMYTKLRPHPGVASIFRKALLKKGINEEQLVEIEAKIQRLIKDKSSLIETNTEAQSTRYKEWMALNQSAWDAKYKSPVTKKMLELAAKQLVTLPKDFSIQKQVSNMLSQRIAMAKGEEPLNWGMGELLAYQVLLNLGHTVRLVGQDAIRRYFCT